MSRYGDRFKDDLYDTLEYQYNARDNMTSLEFFALVLEMLAAIMRDLEWETRD